jgi:hypothetical protein
MCLRYDGLVAEADRAILAHVGESDLENLVPAASDCEKRQFDLGAQVRLVAVCRFDDVVLTFQRLGLGAANLELMRRAQDPGDRPAPSRDR